MPADCVGLPSKETLRAAVTSVPQSSNARNGRSTVVIAPALSVPSETGPLSGVSVAEGVSEAIKLVAAAEPTFFRVKRAVTRSSGSIAPFAEQLSETMLQLSRPTTGSGDSDIVPL